MGNGKVSMRIIQVMMHSCLSQYSSYWLIGSDQKPRVVKRDGVAAGVESLFPTIVGWMSMQLSAWYCRRPRKVL